MVKLLKLGKSEEEIKDLLPDFFAFVTSND